MNDFPALDGKNAVVTGGGSGIGRATALLMAKAGAKVVLIGHTTDEILEVLDEMGGKKSGHFAVQADVGSEIEMLAAYESISRHWEHLDIVVANAGINGVWAPLDQIEVDEWDLTLGTNLRGTF